MTDSGLFALREVFVKDDPLRDCLVGGEQVSDKSEVNMTNFSISFSLTKG